MRAQGRSSRTDLPATIHHSANTPAHPRPTGIRGGAVRHIKSTSAAVSPYAVFTAAATFRSYATVYSALRLKAAIDICMAPQMSRSA
jgi:hypothetical protein